MSTPISTLRNMGPAMEAAFARAGIPDAETLRMLGTDAAYSRLLENGARPHFIPFYVIEMALQGRPWTDCTDDEKKALRVRFDKLKAEAVKKPDALLSELERALNEIGVIEKRA